MEVELDVRKSINENAASYYERAKTLRGKAARAREAAEKTRKEILGLEASQATQEDKPKLRERRRSQWFEKFKWFTSSDGFLCLAGRDAKQNELLVSRHLEDDDLFFHADTHGAPSTVLKKGKSAPKRTLEEAARFAASHSSAWKSGVSTVDVYAVEKSQVSKRAQGGYIGKGAFMISGQRNWFRNTPLTLSLSLNEDGSVSPSSGKGVTITPGNTEKGKIAKRIALLLKADVDEVLRALPPGSSSIEGEKKH